MVPHARAGVRPAARFVHALTAIHALGALACFTMAVGSALSPDFRESLAISGGSRIMVDWLGPGTSVFLVGVGLLLTVLAHASWRLKPWAWPMTIAAYGFGVLGSLWQVSVGIREGWLAACVNATVVAFASTRGVREAYRGSFGSGR